MEKAIRRYWPVFVLPTLIAFIIGFVWPFIWGAGLSFCKFTTVKNVQFVGLSNYAMIWSDNTFTHAFWFTAAFTVVSTLLINVLAFAIALLLTRGMHGTNAFRTIFFLPNLSDSELVATRKPAKTSEYTSTIQRSWSDEGLRSRVSSGSAMLRTVRSMATTNCPNNIATRAVHKRPFESVCGLITIESSIMGVPSYRCFLRYVALLLGAYSSMLSTTPLMSALSPTTAIS